MGLQPPAPPRVRTKTPAAPSSRNSFAAAAHSFSRTASRSSADRARVFFGATFTIYVYIVRLLWLLATNIEPEEPMSLPPVLRDRLRIPVIGSPLFIVSGPELVLAQCKAGIVGAFPTLNARPISQLDEWLHRITEELAAWDRDHPEAPSAPFAVNQIVHKTNNRLEQGVELCAKYKAPIVITSLGAREDVNNAVHGWGGGVLDDVINQTFA